MNQENIKATVNQFISRNFLFDKNRQLDDSVSLLESGVIDSTGILELISFLETTFNLKFRDDELVAENFDSITKIQSFVGSKLNHN